MSGGEDGQYEKYAVPIFPTWIFRHVYLSIKNWPMEIVIFKLKVVLISKNKVRF